MSLSIFVSTGTFFVLSGLFYLASLRYDYYTVKTIPKELRAFTDIVRRMHKNNTVPSGNSVTVKLNLMDQPFRKIEWNQWKTNSIQLCSVGVVAWSVLYFIIGSALSIELYTVSLAVAFTSTGILTFLEPTYYVLSVAWLLGCFVQDGLLFDLAFSEQYNDTAASPVQQDLWSGVMSTIFFSSVFATVSFAFGMGHSNAMFSGFFWIIVTGIMWMYAGIVLFDSVGENVDGKNVFSHFGFIAGVTAVVSFLIIDTVCIQLTKE